MNHSVRARPKIGYRISTLAPALRSRNSGGEGRVRGNKTGNLFPDEPLIAAVRADRTGEFVENGRILNR
jgi:hypothetical protein